MARYPLQVIVVSYAMASYLCTVLQALAGDVSSQAISNAETLVDHWSDVGAGFTAREFSRTRTGSGASDPSDKGFVCPLLSL